MRGLCDKSTPQDKLMHDDGSAHEVTALLAAWKGGNEQALGRLTDLVYDELHRLAKRYMAGERPGHSLQATSLVNEVYLRLIEVKSVSWQNRTHFLAIAARMMRRILVDFARSYQYAKRGGQHQQVTFDECLVFSPESAANLVALHDALDALESFDPRKTRVVELRFFAGLTVEETAEVLKVSQDTVRRDWKVAKVWLLRELSERQPDRCDQGETDAS